jgi:hypothetical protein
MYGPLYQIAVRSGNVVRETVATVLFFKSMIYIVSEVKKWVPEDQVKEFKSVTRSQHDKHWAGVINTDNSSLSQI